jgi:hypothetical protein
MAETPAADQGDTVKEEAAETAPGPLQLIAGWITPDIVVADESTKAEILTKLRQSKGDGLAEHFLAQARQRYDDVFKRVENVERRAGTLQTGVVLAVTFTLTGGALLLDRSKVSSDDWRSVLAVAVFAVVFLFVASGLHATLAVAQTKYWKVVGKYSLHERKFGDVDEARLYRAAAYIWCINHNMPVNQWKADQLGRALRWFIAGLLGLSLVAALVTVYAVWGPAPPPVR